MKTTIWIIVTLIIATGVVFWWSRSRKGRIDSFWDVVKNPGLMPDLDAYAKKVSDEAEELRKSPEEIAKLVDYFVFEATSSRDAWTEQRILRELATDAHPRAIEILRDPLMKEKLSVLTTPDPDWPLPEAPFNRLCIILDSDAPPPYEAAELLVPFATSDSDEIKKSAALIIGSIGRAESLPHIKLALSDSDEYVRSFALMGLERAITGNRVDEKAKSLFFEAVASMWPQDTAHAVSNHIAPLLLRLDRDRAIQRMMRDDLFGPEFHALANMLEAFEKYDVEVPRLKLLYLIEQLRQGPLEYPRDNMLEETLALLGKCRRSEDLVILERLLDHENEDVVMGAIRGLYHYHRLAETTRDPWEIINGKGWTALTPAERHICAIKSLDNEIHNGGFAQYYFNSSGDHWADALAGLDSIGAVKHRELVLLTLKRFPDAAPADEGSIRSGQLSKIVRKQEDPFNEQDSAWYKLKEENLDKLMLRYELANLQGRQK